LINTRIIQVRSEIDRASRTLEPDEQKIAVLEAELEFLILGLEEEDKPWGLK